MRKNILLQAVLLFCGFLSQAQTINKTYGLSNYDLRSQCVVPKPADSIIFMSASAYAYSTYAQSMLLTKTDAIGNVLQTIMIDTPFYDHRLSACDSGVLFASFMNDNLYVIKFNNNLGQLWSVRIPVGYLPVYYPSMTVDIEVTHDYNQNEVYYITCGARTHNKDFANTDMAFSVVKLNNAGQLIWHKTYYDPARASINKLSILDMVRSLDKIDSTGAYFTIAGTRQEVDSIQSTLYPRNYLFFINIDDNGNIVQNYERIETADWMPYDPDVLWDETNQSIVCTYTESNYGHIPGLPGWNIGGIGLIKLGTNLQANTGRYYWRFTDNKGITISSLGDSSYVIGGQVYDADSPYATNPAFLKINTNTLNYERFARYNKYRDVYNTSYHVTDNYGYSYMAPFTNDNVTDQRLIKADMILKTCGSRADTINQLDFNPQNLSYNYSVDSDTIIYNFSYAKWYPDLAMTNCDSLIRPADKDQYKHATNKVYITTASSISVAVAPTLLYSTDEQVHCNIMAQGNETIDIVVYNITGQAAYRKTLQLQSGNNTVILPAGTMAAGLNMVRIYINQQVVSTTKVMLAN